MPMSVSGPCCRVPECSRRALLGLAWFRGAGTVSPLGLLRKWLVWFRSVRGTWRASRSGAGGVNSSPHPGRPRWTIDATARHHLTDAQWAPLEPLVPCPATRGRPRKYPLRYLVDGVRHRTRAGCPWRDVPGRHGTHPVAGRADDDGAVGAGDLTRQPLLDVLAQRLVDEELCGLRSARDQLGLPLRHRRPILQLPASGSGAAAPQWVCQVRGPHQSSVRNR